MVATHACIEHGGDDDDGGPDDDDGVPDVLVGPQGRPGEKGDPGDRGEPGADGDDGHPRHSEARGGSGGLPQHVVELQRVEPALSVSVVGHSQIR